jgi:hypothetical protein
MAALNNAASTLTPPSIVGDWLMDSGATSHMASDAGILLSHSLPPFSSHFTVGNGVSLPISSTGHTTLPLSSCPFALNNVLIVPHIIKNLLSIRKFSTTNNVSIKFDPFVFSLKELRTRRVITHCNSPGPLYTIFASQPPPYLGLVSTSTNNELWHSRLGHPGCDTISHLSSKISGSCNNASATLCHACQLGKHVRLPFSRSKTLCVVPFQLIHCDCGHLQFLVILV